MKRLLLYMAIAVVLCGSLTAGTIASKVRVYALPSDSLMFVVDYGNGGTLLTRKIHYEDFIEIIASSLASAFLEADGDQLVLADSLYGLKHMMINDGPAYTYGKFRSDQSVFCGQDVTFEYYTGAGDTTARIVSKSGQILNMFKTLDLWGKMSFKNESGDSAGYMEVIDPYGKLLINTLMHSATFKGSLPTADIGPVWTIYNTSGTNAGMELHLGKESASPASGDTLAVMYIDGKNDNGDTEAMHRWIWLQGIVTDGAEGGRRKQEIKRAGEWVVYEEVGATGVKQNYYKDQVRMTWELGETFTAPGPFLGFIDGDDATGRIFKFDADSSRHPNWPAVVVEDAGVAGDTVDIIISGYSSGWGGLSRGHKVWASRSADNITTSPDTNYVMQYIGRALSATEMWFEPSGNWSEK